MIKDYFSNEFFLIALTFGSYFVGKLSDNGSFLGGKLSHLL